MTTRTMDLATTDGQRVAATLFEPTQPARGVVVVLGATGAAQRFYRRFAEALTAHGLEAVTVDYRGIGASKPGGLRGFVGDCRDWAERDAWAAVDFALRRGPTAVVGHSFGGHAFGQLPEPNRTLGLYSVGSGAAWSGYMTAGERIKVEFFWRVMGPVATRLWGYLPGKVWGGEDLPLGVYADWRRWSQCPRYFFDDPQMNAAAKFDRVTVPVVGVTATDDAWAPPRSVEVLLSHYRNAPLTLEAHAPADLGVDALGHFGHFKGPVAGVLASRVANWVSAQLGAGAA